MMFFQIQSNRSTNGDISIYANMVLPEQTECAGMEGWESQKDLVFSLVLLLSFSWSLLLSIFLNGHHRGEVFRFTVSMQGQIFQIISGACTVNLQWIRQGKNVSYVLTVPADLKKGWNK